MDPRARDRYRARRLKIETGPYGSTRVEPIGAELIRGKVGTVEPSNDDRDTLACAEHAEALGENATVRALAGEGYTGDLRAYVRACVERWRPCHDCGAVGGVQLHGDPHVAEYRCAACAAEVEADRAGGDVC